MSKRRRTVMREAEKREFKDNQLVQEFLKAAEREYGEKKVSYTKNSDGIMTITIQAGDKKVTRKHHSRPKYSLKSGD